MATRDIRSFAAAAAILAALIGCTAPGAPKTAAPLTPASTGSAIPIALFTHCGIYEVRVKDAFYVADQRLDDGNGNPPAGWGNPYQSGTITVEGQRAIFTDDRGHAVAFRERPGATSLLRTCS